MEQLFFAGKASLKINSLVKKPLHEFMAVERGYGLLARGVARGGGGGSWGARDPLLVGLLLSKQPTIFRWRKRHDNILAVKAIVEKPTFLKFVFLSSIFVNGSCL